MKAIIPAAGQGTRLYPQTHTKPKPMVRVAGKPILGHILDRFVDSPVDEVVVIVGVMQDIVIEYVATHYDDTLTVSFAEQAETKGLGHSIYQARSRVGSEPVCIALGDMLFDSDYAAFLEAHDQLDGVDGSFGVKAVEDPSNYGVVTMDGERVEQLEEKPADPDSDLAISGFYVIEDAAWLFEAIEWLLENDHRGAGDEYQLTDALQYMIDDGAVFGSFDVGTWYDCGRPETLLEANRVQLERTNGHGEQSYRDSSVIIQPADIGDDVTLTNSVVGPYVSVDNGASITESHVADSIIGQEARIEQANLARSIVGDNATVVGNPYELNVGDYSDVKL